MSGGEIVGDIAQGALTARAFEPAHGEAPADGHTHEAACLNCGAALVGTHCHSCGQAAHVHKTLGAFFHDILHGVFHFEGKIWRTLPLLAWRPGQLTREYIDGRRASYVSPIALFLFSVFLMFATIHALAPGGSGGFNPSIASGVAGARTDLAELEAQRGKIVAAGKDASSVDRKIVSAKEDLAALEKLRREGATVVPTTVGENNWKSSIPALDELLGKARANPDLVLYKLQSSAYKYSWLLIPLSVPFVWLLFPFSRRFGLYDHTVFVTYSLCFMTLLVVALSAAGWLGLPLVGVAAVFVPPWHLYRQLKGTYALSRLGALWRTSVLLIVCTITLILFAMAVVGLGLTN